MIRIHGELAADPRHEPLHPRGHRARPRTRCSTTSDSSREFAEENEVDFSYALPGLARFRVNAFRQRGSISFVMRAIPLEISRSRSSTCRTSSASSPRRSAASSCDRHDRLGQVDDARGDDRPHQRDDAKHIVTIEDPIEFLHPTSSRHQPARGRPGHRVVQARAAPRAAPGPGRDPDRRDARRGDGRTPRSPPPRPATSCSRRCTRSTRPRPINRIIDFFPPHMQQQVRAMLAGTLKGVDLPAPRADVGRRAASPACEVLRMTGRVRDMIMDPDADRQARPRSSPRAATTGCRPSTRRCSSTCRPAAITMDEALQAATSPHDFKLLVAADGKQGHDDGRRRGRREAPRRPARRLIPASRAHSGATLRTTLHLVK